MGGRTAGRTAPGPAGQPTRLATAGTGTPWRARAGDLRPMLAVLAEAPTHTRLLARDDLVFEPKYDGIRALIEVGPAGGQEGGPGDTPRIRIWSRLGNDKTAQFPEVVQALGPLARRLTAPLCLDGEIVAVDAGGDPLSFQHLQGRMHRRGGPRTALPPTDVAFVAFDLLRDGPDDLRPLTFTQRRARLARRLRPVTGPVLRLTRSQTGGGMALREEALAHDWEGVVAKDPASRYLSGKRHPGWRKIKFVSRQEFVVGGWTAGRQSRSHFGALLVGYYPGGAAESTTDSLVYAGHVGSGFSDAELAAIADLLCAIETDASPFATVPRSGGQTRWVRPSLVIEVKFTQWTADGVLRNPVYLGVRPDMAHADVRREEGRRRQEMEGLPASTVPKAAGRRQRSAVSSRQGEPRAVETRSTRAARRPRTAPPGDRPAGSPPVPASAPGAENPAIETLCDRLQELEASRRRSTLVLPDGTRVPVGNLHKVFWPEPGLTKGDLVRFNLRMSPYLLPVVADRPLVMKRFPNGIEGKWFYQHRAPDPIPDGTRVALVPERIDHPDSAVPYLIGGTLQTLAYMAQLAVISQDPWFSRLPDIADADVVALDLDPMPDASFSRVLEVARWLHDELDRLRVPCVAKTSGASGLHIYIPLPPGTPYDAGTLFCQILATIVASRHPRAATVERMVKKRPSDVIYIDYLQNIYGKTLACAYSARASPFAGVSTPLTWREVHEGLQSGLSPRDFTMRTVRDRLRAVGDLWAPLRTGPPADLRAALQYAAPG